MLLEVNDLRVSLPTPRGVAEALHGVSFALEFGANAIERLLSARRPSGFAVRPHGRLMTEAVARIPRAPLDPARSGVHDSVTATKPWWRGARATHFSLPFPRVPLPPTSYADLLHCTINSVCACLMTCQAASAIPDLCSKGLLLSGVPFMYKRVEG
jgi:hypothetical protein